jgi:MtN3 and saliva related transmembrane protein
MSAIPSRKLVTKKSHSDWSELTDFALSWTKHRLLRSTLMTITTIGYVAGFLTTLSFVPQVIRAYRTRSVNDLSWVWLSVFMAGLLGWLTYGLILRDWPMILANTITISLCVVLMYMKARYRNLPGR